MSEAALHSAQLGPELADLQRAPHWYVGYSGGLDSTVLLHLLQQWRAANPGAPALTAIHVNHCLQAAADAWQVHCEQQCHALGVPLISRTEPVRASGQGIEAAARAVRYGIFERQLQAGAVLFLGHHLDDQVETFFLRLMRGAGLQGLAAMPARRPLGRGVLVRPLLRVPRTRLEDCAREHHLRWVEDPSNTDTALDRNFLRRQLLPALASRWPAYRQTVARAGDHLAAAAALLQELSPAPATVYSAMGDPGLAVADLLLDVRTLLRSPAPEITDEALSPN